MLRVLTLKWTVNKLLEIGRLNNHHFLRHFEPYGTAQRWRIKTVPSNVDNQFIVFSASEPLES